MNPIAPPRARSSRRKVVARLILVVLTVITAVAGFYRTGRPSAEALAARHAFSAGRYAEANEHVERWLRAAPGSSEAHFLKARNALELGHPDVANAEVQRAKELGLSKADLELFQAIIDAHQGRQAKAEPFLRLAFESAVAPDPQVEESLARVYLETYQLKRAAEVLDRWARDQPNDPRPHLWRAEIDFRADNGTDALIDDYRQALKRDPDLPKARLGLAEALRSEHRNGEADPEYRAYLALKPDDAAGYIGAGRNALELGETDSANRYAERALTLDPKHTDAHKLRADIALRTGDLSTALAHLDRAIGLDPFDLNLRHSRGIVLGRLGRPAEAKAEQDAANRIRSELQQLDNLKSRLSRTPRDLELQTQIAQWLLDHGHEAEGVEWATKILHDQPSHLRTNRLLADYYDRIGNKGLANFYRVQAGAP